MPRRGRATSGSTSWADTACQSLRGPPRPERDTGVAYVLEIDRRITPGSPTGALVEVDLCAALRAAIEDVPNPSRRRLDGGEEHVIAHFPQEWLRDPASAYLRSCRVDAPWNDPGLFRAMASRRPA